MDVGGTDKDRKKLASILAWATVNQKSWEEESVTRTT